MKPYIPAMLDSMSQWDSLHARPFFANFFKDNADGNAPLIVFAINFSECRPDMLFDLLFNKYTAEQITTLLVYILENDPYRRNNDPTWSDVAMQRPFPGYYVVAAHDLMVQLHERGISLLKMKDAVLGNMISARQKYWPEYLESTLRPVFDDVGELYRQSIHWRLDNDPHFIELSKSLLYGFDYFREIPIQTRKSILKEITDASRVSFRRRWMLRKSFLRG